MRVLHAFQSEKRVRTILQIVLTRLFAPTVVLAVVLSAVVLARDFGPEWTRDGLYYGRNQTVPVSHYVDGNVTGYAVALEHDQISIGEIDDNAGFSMGSAPYGRFEVNKAKGKPTSIKVEIKQLMYYDLDANGTLDTMTDLRGLDPKTFIFIDNQIVQVEHTRGGGGASLANSLDRTQNFKFEAGKWRRVE